MDIENNNGNLEIEDYIDNICKELSKLDFTECCQLLQKELKLDSLFYVDGLIIHQDTYGYLTIKLCFKHYDSILTFSYRYGKFTLAERRKESVDNRITCDFEDSKDKIVFYHLYDSIKKIIGDYINIKERGIKIDYREYDVVWFKDETVILPLKSFDMNDLIYNYMSLKDEIVNRLNKSNFNIDRNEIDTKNILYNREWKIDINSNLLYIQMLFTNDFEEINYKKVIYEDNKICILRVEKGGLLILNKSNKLVDI